MEEAQGPEVDGENVARLPDSIPDEAEEIAREEPAVRVVPDPGEPTLEERARHALTDPALTGLGPDAWYVHAYLDPRTLTTPSHKVRSRQA